MEEKEKKKDANILTTSMQMLLKAVKHSGDQKPSFFKFRKKPIEQPNIFTYSLILIVF